MQAKSREEITSDKSRGIETWVSRGGAIFQAIIVPKYYLP